MQRRSSILLETAAWALVACATGAAIADSIHESLARYRTLDSGWSWDLAYYNQWCWAFTHGDGRITVQPIADYATEGPSVWKTNYLAPIRYAILPVYAQWPRPETLLIVHAIIFWLVLPASYSLVRSETGSRIAGLIAIGFVWLTPLFAPLALNDFRELQLGTPFVIWAVLGVRSRSIPIAVLGVVGVLACRQEFALFVATLAVVPPRQPESVVTRFRWARALWLVGLLWLTVMFFGFLVITCGWHTPEEYLLQFRRESPGLLTLLLTAAEILAVGMGAFGILSLAMPRAALLWVPWLWSLGNGRWAMRLLATPAWHHVRYAAPFAATCVAGGLLGGSRLWRFAGRFARPWAWRAAGIVVVATMLVVARSMVLEKWSRAPKPVDVAAARELWQWIKLVPPEDAVLAHYDVTAPLSSRRVIYSYVMRQNRPSGFPDALGNEIVWVFCRETDIDEETLRAQGFASIEAGPIWRIYRRGNGSVPGRR